MDRIAVFETMTGRIILQPAVSEYSWSDGINDAEGSIQVTTTTGEVSANVTKPWTHSLAVIDGDGFVLAAGPLYKRDIDMAAGKVTLTAGSFWSFLKKRIFQRDGHPILADNTHYWIATDGTRTEWRQTYTSSLGGIACGLIRSQFRDLPGVDAFPYPSGTRTRTYDGLELQTVADLVRALFDDQNPPILRFYGVLADGVITWAVDILGETRQPSRWVFDLDAEGGLLKASKVNEDAGSAISRSWFVSKPSSGAPDGNMSLFAQATRPLAAGEPRMSAADSSHSDVSDGNTADSYAAAAAYSTPYLALDVTVARNSVALAASASPSIRPGDVVVVSTSRGFYGPSTFAGRVVDLRGSRFELTLSLENVERADGPAPGLVPSAAIQRPAGDANSRLKALEAFQRRMTNPVTDKPGVPVIRTPIALTYGSEFANVDLTVTRIDPLGIVVVEGEVSVPSLIVGGGAHTVATLADSFPLTQISVSAFRQGSTSETLQAYVTPAGALMVRPDPTFYSGNIIVFSGMYSIVY